MRQHRRASVFLSFLLLGTIPGIGAAAERPATVGISVVSAPWSAPALLRSTATDHLQRDVTTFDNTLNIYITNGKKLDSDLQLVLKGLDLINTMATNLKKLDDALTSAEKLIKYAQAVPQTEEAANKLAHGMESIHPPVTKASKAINDFNDKITPTRQKLETFDDRLQKSIAAAERFERDLNTYNADIQKAQQCISSLPDGSMKSDLQTRIDQLARQSDKRVVDANKLLQGILKTIDAIDEKITKDVSKLFQPIDDMESDIARVLKDLTAILNPLQDLKAVFDKSFSVSFPYPAPTWKHPFRMKHYTLDIGFDIIIRGEAAIKKEIEQLLKKDLYKAAEVFGLDKLIDDLERQGKKALDPVLKELHLDINMDISGIGQLPQDLNDLRTALDGLVPSLDVDLKPLDDAFKGIEDDIREMKNIYQNCK